MKIKQGFVLRKFQDQWLAIATDDLPTLQNALVTLNKTGAFVWQCLQQETSYDTLLERITDQYDVDTATARADLDRFIEIARKAGLLEE